MNWLKKLFKPDEPLRVGVKDEYEELRKEKKQLEEKIARLKTLVPYAQKHTHEFYIHLFFGKEEVIPDLSEGIY